jgi:acyl-CoA reductase-like NAD-dependent aldehyde dehydrogenase
MIPLQAELSGNNAAIVCDDADLEHAAKQVAWGAFAFAGQRCTANRRVILSPGIRARFLCELEMASAALPWGDPLEESTEIGPMISAERRDEVAAALEQAASESRTIVLPDRAQAGREWVRAGAYQQPAIVCCDEPGHWLVQEETMGPLLVVQSARDFEHSLELCNGVRHGLAAALFTRSNEMRDKFLNGAMAGVLKLNTSTAGADATLPFTGWKASGIGPPEHGEGDRLFYTRTQAVY